MPYANKEDRAASQKRYRENKKKKLIDYLDGKICVDCGENDPIVLEFDHVDRSTKRQDVGKLVTSSHCSWKTVLREIDKCEIRCANCHRRKTYKESGFNSRG